MTKATTKAPKKTKQAQKKKALGRDSPPESRRRRPPANLAALLASGDSYTAIGKILSVDRETVSAWSKRPDIQRQLQAIQQAHLEETRVRLAALQTKALGAVDQVLTPATQGGACDKCLRPFTQAEDKDRLKAAEMVFDRTGFGKRTTIETVPGELVGKSDDEVDSAILTEAIAILRARGLAALALEVEAHV